MTTKVQAYRLTMKKAGVIRVAESRVCSCIAAATIAHAMLDSEPFEHMIAIMVNAANDVIGVASLASTGAVSGCSVDIKAILKAALVANASAVILSHNHPSGDPTPSNEDRDFTTRATEAFKVIGLSLLDHVIVSPNGRHYSFQDKGIL